MKEKLAIVAAFMGEPDIIFLDEPSTGLDPLMQDKLIKLFNLFQRDTIMNDMSNFILVSLVLIIASIIILFGTVTIFKKRNLNL
ncbi:MAG: hypothetical protein IJH34_14155 [Romboutsia sp.]|nr:hypothetical protein [Romboutsia sp.]SFU31684.1 hypothetical protein SAMN04487886_10066 [Clostridium sp. DSM 8431]